MSSASIWRGEVLASTLSSAKAGQGSTLLREAAIENRLAALREVALTLLEAVDSLRGSQPSRDQNLRLQDEVQRFESDLIRTALERTGGNQARAARLLGVKHTTLNAKIKRYQIQCDGHANEGARAVGGREIAA
ncbi:MAG: Bacterial regulatory protein Fis family [Blastocatellia bacterium]|jgi:transcriptional regulator with GAF, ATPase, and Fis domain|nr:Bacterial regulatory protein Fis family [Blastocatellia bacterium]